MTSDAILIRLLPAVPELLPQCLEPPYQAYLRSYREFVRHAQALRPIDDGAVVLVAGLVYSWIPRHLRLGTAAEISAAAAILEAARRQPALTAGSFEGLATALGGSPMAASTALHLFHPELYPMWDPRVWRALGWHSSEVRADAGARYLRYVGLAVDAAAQPEFSPVHRMVEGTLHYPVSRIRALELLLCLSGGTGSEE